MITNNAIRAALAGLPQQPGHQQVDPQVLGGQQADHVNPLPPAAFPAPPPPRPVAHNNNNNATTSSSNFGSVKFPVQLHQLLHDAEQFNFESIVSWVPGLNNCFKVYDTKKFVSIIMPFYFPRQSHYKSFLRQLNLYKFKRSTRGVNRGSYYHPLMVRGNYTICHTIERGSSGNPTGYNVSLTPMPPSVLEVFNSTNTFLQAEANNYNNSTSADDAAVVADLLPPPRPSSTQPVASLETNKSLGNYYTQGTRVTVDSVLGSPMNTNDMTVAMPIGVGSTSTTTSPNSISFNSNSGGDGRSSINNTTIQLQARLQSSNFTLPNNARQINVELFSDIDIDSVFDSC